ncbi:heterocyst-inhibiting signaling peptide PatS [Nostoc sp. 'Lobaria pulmonaria (5183) cyanobiont']|nr:heterocyst-inhibiting signaling peptide PatS [Nostoc sp. 'Lobaria pulmonaria (5183) cyanobiont']
MLVTDSGERGSGR